MWIGVLGPLEVHLDGSDVPIETAKERELLSALAVRCPAAVSRAWLIDVLWGSDPPATAGRTLASHVSRLRHSIGAPTVLTEPDGYRLDPQIAHVDVIDLADLTESAEVELGAGRPTTARSRAADALALWRSAPLADVANEEIRISETVRLDELRRRATHVFVEAELALGHHQSVIGDLETVIARDPLHEPTWGQLMIALYRSGRQADALRAYQRLRQTLRVDLGIDPSPSIARIELQILRQEADLELSDTPPPNNLPNPASSFIGRVDELRDVTKMLTDHQLVTLVGPGGIGKTRLALAVADRLTQSYADGVWWLDLAPVRDPGAVLAQLATTLGVTARRAGTLDDAVREFVGNRELLLIIDNCEHLVGEVGDIVEQLIGSGPSVVVLATSRERLGLPGETRYLVTPLRLPSDGGIDGEATESDAVRLFVERAVANTADVTSDDELQAIVAICRKVNGVPLAVELAAGRTATFSPRQIAERLDDHIASVATESAIHDPRYHSLDEAIAWSEALLSPTQRDLLSQLTVFPGRFDSDAVFAVCRTDSDNVLADLAHLSDASMLDVDVGAMTTRSGGPRFRVLEVIRSHAAQRLDPATRSAVRRRHAHHYRDVALGMSNADVALSGDAIECVRRDDANFRAAYTWLMEHDPGSATFEFALVLGNAWYLSGNLAGAMGVLDETTNATTGIDDARRGRRHLLAVWPLLLSGEAASAWSHLDDAQRCAASSGDRRLAAAVATARAHSFFLGIGDIEQSLPLYTTALEACALADVPMEYMTARLGMAQALILADRPSGVAAMLDEVESMLEHHPDEGQRAHLCLDRALLAWATGDIAAIAEPAEAGQRHAAAAGNAAWAQINLVAAGYGCLLRGDVPDAEFTLLRAARWANDEDNATQLGVALEGLAAVAALRGAAVRAARLHGAAEAVTPRWPLLRRGLEHVWSDVRNELGEHFEFEVDRGRGLERAEVLSLALDAN